MTLLRTEAPSAPKARVRRAPSPILVSALAVAVVLSVGVWAFSLRVDSVVHDGYSEGLRRMIALQHRLNEQVLRKYAGLAGSYDPLVRTMRELRDLHRQAALVPAFIDATGQEEIRARLAESAAVLETQGSVVEQFKTENAILLNSLRYFPLAAAEVADALSREPGTEAQVAQVRDLLRDVLRIAVSPTADALREVEEHIATIHPEGARAEEVRVVLRHATLITHGRQTVDHLLGALLEQAGADDAAALGAAYARHYQLSQARAHNAVNLFLVFVALAVLGVAASIFARMRADAESIRAASLLVAQSIDRQNRFVSMTSHEFRTPLSVMISSADLLRAYGSKWGPEQHDKHLSRIERAGRGMTELLDGILLIGRTDAGHRDFRPGRVDLAALTLDVVETQRARAKSGITIEYTPGPTALPIVADGRLLRHVLDNLVSNAVKYSKAGGVVRVATAHANGEVHLEVEDNGIGIPLADQEKLFDTFHRAANVGSVQGTGLGLAIVKRAVDLHGGKIAVTSSTEKGTRFDIRIPVSSSDAVTSGESDAMETKEGDQ